METFVGDTPMLRLNCGINISAYTTKRIKYRKPDGTEGYWTSSICPTDNTCMRYQIVTADLDVAGKWEVQSYVIEGAARLHGYWAEFKVYDPIL